MAAQPVFKTLALVLRSLRGSLPNIFTWPLHISTARDARGWVSLCNKRNPIHRDCLVKSYGRGDFREGRGEGQEEGKVRGK